MCNTNCVYEDYHGDCTRPGLCEMEIIEARDEKREDEMKRNVTGLHCPNCNTHAGKKFYLSRMGNLYICPECDESYSLEALDEAYSGELADHNANANYHLLEASAVRSARAKLMAEFGRKAA